MSRFVGTTAVVAVCSPLILSSPPAQAADCNTLPNPVFAPGTTDAKPYLSRVAPALGSAPTDPMTIVYLGVSSCTALDYVTGDAELTGTAVYWDAAGAEQSCDLVASDTATVALSDVTHRTCRGDDLPAGLDARSSYVQAFGLVVPQNSSQQAITAQEGFELFSFAGAEGHLVAPWIDPALVMVRTPASSTQLLIGLAVGVPGTMWSADLTNINSGSSDVVSKVAAESSTGNADQTIGILSVQKYDQNRDQLRMLAFQANNQQCLGAVYPDSTPTALDKQNVRDGHYAIWGYLWTFLPIDSNGDALDPLAARFVDFVTGTETVNGADPIADAALAGAVPDCAMQVRREQDGGALERYTPNEPCGCYFEAVVTGTTSCAECDNMTCASGSCRFGYCEES